MNVKFERPDVEKLKREHMLVDMHFHSRYSHDCSTPIKTIIDKCREIGVYVALTDHNSIKGVLAAQKIAPGIIKPGVEVTTKEGKDILIYFYEYDDLESFFTTHVEPYIPKKSSLRGGKTGVKMAHLLGALKDKRCIVSLAHPFAIGVRRSYRFFKNGRGSAMMEQVDAFEVINQNLPHKNNLSSIGWAMQYDKAFTCGSDGHVISLLGSAFTACKADTWHEFLDSVLAKKGSVVAEERKMRHHVASMSNILHEKTKVFSNRKIRKERI